MTVFNLIMGFESYPLSPLSALSPLDPRGCWDSQLRLRWWQHTEMYLQDEMCVALCPKCPSPAVLFGVSVRLSFRFAMICGDFAEGWILYLSIGSLKTAVWCVLILYVKSGWTHTKSEVYRGNMFFFSVLFIDFPEQQGLVYRILDITIGTLFVATETPGCCDKIPWLTGRARLRGRPCNRDCQDRMPCFTGLPESTQ